MGTPGGRWNGGSQDWMLAIVRVPAFVLMDGVPSVYYMIKITLKFLIKVSHTRTKEENTSWSGLWSAHHSVYLKYTKKLPKNKNKRDPCLVLAHRLPAFTYVTVSAAGRNCIHPSNWHTFSEGSCTHPWSLASSLTFSVSMAHTLSDMPYI